MKLALVLIFLIGIYEIRALEDIKQNDIPQFLQLNTEDWEKLLNEHDNVIVLTTPNHPNMMQVFDEVVGTLELLVDPKTNIDPEILALQFFLLNCTNDSDFCAKNRIYPGAITWFYKGAFWSGSAITPQWNSDSLNFWININLSHDLNDISSQFKKYTSCPLDRDFTVVLFDETGDQKNILSLIKLKLAIKSVDSYYFKVTDPNLIRQEAEDRTQPFVKVYQCAIPEDPSFFINLNDSASEISNLITLKSYAKVSRISNPTMKFAFENHNVTLIVGLPEDYETGELFDWLEKLNNTAILWEHSQHLQGFVSAGCSGTVWPTAVAVVDHGTKPLSFNENLSFNLENVQKWIDNINAGNHESFKKSKKIDPVENAGKALKEITFNDFEEKVLQASHPVVVSFVASRQACGGGYCNTAVGILEKVQEYFEYTFPDFPLEFYIFDAEFNYPVRPEFGIPATVIFDKGTEVQYPLPRRQKFYEVKNWINEFFSLQDPHEEL